MMFDGTSPGDLALLRHIIHGQTVDAALLRSDIGLEIEAFPTAIKRLRKLGCDIEQISSTSCRLIKSSLRLWQEYLEYTLPLEGVRPGTIRVYKKTASTQDGAKGFAPGWALVIADQQTAGRGRLGRRWVSAHGKSVLMSLCWPINAKPITHERVSMLTGLAVAKAVEGVLKGPAVRLKWPNDVMIHGRKLAGILIEAVSGAFIIGIGLNVRQGAVVRPSLTGIATSLASHDCGADRLYVIERIVIELDKALRLSDQRAMLDEWRACAALGQTQTFEHDNQRLTGTVLDLDPDHGLIVRRDTGEIVTLPAATTSTVK